MGNRSQLLKMFSFEVLDTKCVQSTVLGTRINLLLSGFIQKVVSGENIVAVRLTHKGEGVQPLPAELMSVNPAGEQFSYSSSTGCSGHRDWLLGKFHSFYMQC